MKDYGDPSMSIYLRPMTGEDTDLIVSWRNQEAVRRNFIYQELFTPESHRQWIRDMVETGRVVQMMICESVCGRPVGSVYLRDIDRRHSKAEYGIFIGGEGARGKGYGTMAARLMIRYAFREMGLHRLFLRVFADNARAIRSYEKAGFEREAYLREDVCIEGQYRDMVLMGILNPGNPGERIHDMPEKKES